MGMKRNMCTYKKTTYTHYHHFTHHDLSDGPITHAGGEFMMCSPRVRRIHIIRAIIFAALYVVNKTFSSRVGQIYTIMHDTSMISSTVGKHTHKHKHHTHTHIYIHTHIIRVRQKEGETQRESLGASARRRKHPADKKSAIAERKGMRG
jgi:hypothetical protein